MGGRKIRGFSLLKTALLFMFPVFKVSFASENCEHNFNNDSCIDEAVCYNYADYTAVGSTYNCYDKMYNGNIPLMKLVYMGTNEELEEIPRTLDDLTCTIIEELDVSKNRYNTFPPLRNDMIHLKVLNVSNNFITTAVLGSKYHFPALETIDFSHNIIDDIEMIDSEITFSSLIRLNISNNHLRKIKERIFLQLNNLQYLDASFNEIINVNAYTFESLTSLVYLNLAHNKIKELSGSLLRLSNLQYIYANDNKLNSLLLSDFSILNNLQKMDFSNNLITTIEKNIFNNKPNLSTINLKRNFIKVLDKFMFSNTSLQHIDLSFNEIQLIPKCIFKGKNISYFAIQSNNLGDALVKGTFEGLLLVLKLDLSYQNIGLVQDYAFVGLDHVEEILLNNNKISSVSLKSFNNLKKLKHLDLSNNQIGSLDFQTDDLIALQYLSLRNNLLTFIKKDNFDGLHILQFLDISNNNISQIESYSFLDMGELVHFDVSKNPLVNSIKNNTFDGLNSLPILDISCSAVTNIQNNSFNNMFCLDTLNISHSALSEISFNAFINTGNIKVLDISYNLLHQFDINTTTLKNLKALYLDHNIITTLSFNFFTSMALLTTINLSFNNIKQLEDKMISTCKELSYLDLSYNNEIKFSVSLIENLHHLERLFLSGIPRNITFDSIVNSSLLEIHMSDSSISNLTYLKINRFRSLKVMILTKNNIKVLEVEIFSNLTQLNLLDLSFNELTSLPPGIFKGNFYLEVLNISHNHLTAPSYGVFHGLMSLHTLDLSYNEIQDLKSGRFYNIPNLHNLIVDFNKISEISFDEFSRFLSVLSIGGNPLPCDILVSYHRSDLMLNITAMTFEYKEKLNNLGITCIDRKEIKRTENINFSASDTVLRDIRDILLNISMRKPDKEINPIIDHNMLLEIYLKLNNSSSAVATTSGGKVDSSKLDNTLLLRPIPMHNYKSNLDSNINSVTDDNNVNDTIQSIANYIRENNSNALFNDICIGLLLLIVLCFVTFKVYESLILTPRRKSFSMQQIVIPMDNSHV